MVEVHPRPEEALSDAEQQLNLDEFRELMAAIVPVHEHVRGLHGNSVLQGSALGIGGSGGGLARH
jgi:3-deoxy-D-manno-octulosonic acid (KDO) 8-phosphate synthase